MNRRLTISLILSVCSFSFSLAQNIHPSDTKSYTFVVDKGLSAPKESLRISSGKNIARLWIEQEGGTKKVASSFDNENFHFSGYSTFFNCLVQAYADHRSLVLSPDMIWLLISQGFSHYVNLQPEKMRSKIMSFENKKTLTVQSGDLYSSEANWENLLSDFSKEIKNNTKGDLVDMMTANFSTTGKTEYIASQITLMSSVKSYFDFVDIYISCGIPSITLEGTSDDWRRVLEKTQGLRDYGLGWWVDDLEPILQEFINASEGNVDRGFWQDIVTTSHYRLENGGCLKKSSTVDGWFLKFMPFDQSGRTPNEVPYNSSNMLPEVSSADFEYQVVDDNNKLQKSVKMTMIGGLVGVDVDTIANTLRPKIGWIVCESGWKEDLAEKFMTHGYKGKKIPEVLNGIGFMPYFSMYSKKFSTLPEGIDSLKVDVIKLEGKMSAKLIQEIKNKFADRNVEVSDEYSTASVRISANKTFAPDDYVFTDHEIPYDTAYVYQPAECPVKDYISNNRRIPESVYSDKKERSDHEYERKITVSYIIEKDGSISNVYIDRKGSEVTPEQEQGAIRLISSLPIMKPAMRKISSADRLQPVRSRQSTRIGFTIGF